MDIVGLGINTVQQLAEEGLVTDIADLYTLQKSDLLKLEGFGDKKADNVLSSIEGSKSQPLSRLITGLGIRGVGEVAAQDLAKRYHNLDQICSANKEEIENMPGFGPNIAQSIVEWFINEENREVLHKIKANGVWPEEETPPEAGPQPLGGLTFVVTGTLPSLSRTEAKQLIESSGGKVTGSVSGSTSYLVLGESPGSKYDQAVKRNVPILSEDELRQLIRERSI